MIILSITVIKNKTMLIFKEKNYDNVVFYLVKEYFWNK